MTKDDAPLVEMFLRLKANANKGIRWTADERAAVRESLSKGGDLSILAACCVFVSRCSEKYPGSLEVLQKAIEKTDPASYVELSIYEALIYLEIQEIARVRDPLLSFVEQSITRRAISLDNTIFLLGRLARTGEIRSLRLLKSLAHDPDDQIRGSALRVLDGLRDD